jgi:hypothetical protein
MAKALYLQAKAAAHKVSYIGNLQYEVISGTSGEPYTVTLNPNLDGGTCTCKRSWFVLRANTGQPVRCPCSHVTRCVEVAAQEMGFRLTGVYHAKAEAQATHRMTVQLGDNLFGTLRPLGA